jgi:C4-dicarboxylate-specific signal transduction histidine kinase
MQAKEISLLLIEDNADHRELVRRHLSRCENATFRVTVAQRLSEGLERLRQVPVQAILLDLRLPDSSGAETLEQVCRAAPESAIVILSSLEDQNLVVAAVQHGAQDYLVKSQLTSELLSRSIRYAIDRKSHETDLERLVSQRTAALQETNTRLAKEIEEHKRAREQLAQQHERLLQSERLAAIGEMVAGLAHESRNALQRSQACLSMLANRVDDRPKAAELVLRAQQAQDDLHRLYERVRQYAAPIRLDQQTVSIGDILAQTWEHLAVTRVNRNIQLLVEPQTNDTTCRADRMAMEQVFRNVLENALAACDDPVQITVTWTDAELDGCPAIQISIRDNGPGFTGDHSKRLFEPFFTTKTKGTGLGLAISKRIVESHAGRIAARNYPGGAEILITLPREGNKE